MTNKTILLYLSLLLIQCRSFTETNRDSRLLGIDRTLLPDSELTAETRFELDSDDPFDRLITNDFRRATAHKLLQSCARMDAFDQVEIAIPDTQLASLKASRDGEIRQSLPNRVAAQYTIRRTERGNFLWELFSSLTLFIVPYKATEEYDVTVYATVRNKKGSRNLHITKKSRQTAWFSIIYFFHMFSRENVLTASDRIAYEAIDDATRELVIQSVNNR